MILSIVAICVGVGLVLWGADRFTDGASGIARRWGVSELIIGLTVVALGTSLPEFVVSLFSALSGSADMSAGNIVGSNIFNTLIIVGASAIAMPLLVDKNTLTRQMPICLVSTLMLMAFGLMGGISRLNALILFVLFILFIYYNLRLGMQQKAEANTAVDETPLWKTITLLIVGIAALVAGGQLLVTHAANIARMWGVSEATIGLTILAGGTSLPELATSVVAARKGSAGLALGNAIGSNIFNITFVLGVCGMIQPLQIEGLHTLDWWMLVFSLLLLWLGAATGRCIRRGEGFCLLVAYLAYLIKMLTA